MTTVERDTVSEPHQVDIRIPNLRVPTVGDFDQIVDFWVRIFGLNIYVTRTAQIQKIDRSTSHLGRN